MKDILILFAHPKFEQSRTNRALLRNIRDRTTGVTFHDLYERYPDFDIDVDFEKQLLKRHEVIIWHHPFYWYSCPPLMKQWIDLVLEFGWAYGPGGEALTGKTVLQVVTTCTVPKDVTNIPSIHSCGHSSRRHGSVGCSISRLLQSWAPTGFLSGNWINTPFNTSKYLLASNKTSQSNR